MSHLLVPRLVWVQVLVDNLMSEQTQRIDYSNQGPLGTLVEASFIQENAHKFLFFRTSEEQDSFLELLSYHNPDSLQFNIIDRVLWLMRAPFHFGLIDARFKRIYDAVRIARDCYKLAASLIESSNPRHHSIVTSEKRFHPDLWLMGKQLFGLVGGSVSQGMLKETPPPQLAFFYNNTGGSKGDPIVIELMGDLGGQIFGQRYFLGPYGVQGMHEKFKDLI